MILRPPGSKRAATLIPYTTLCRYTGALRNQADRFNRSILRFSSDLRAASKTISEVVRRGVVKFDPRPTRIMFSLSSPHTIMRGLRMRPKHRECDWRYSPVRSPPTLRDLQSIWPDLESLDRLVIPFTRGSSKERT